MYYTQIDAEHPPAAAGATAVENQQPPFYVSNKNTKKRFIFCVNIYSRGESTGNRIKWLPGALA